LDNIFYKSLKFGLTNSCFFISFYSSLQRAKNEKNQIEYITVMIGTSQ